MIKNKLIAPIFLLLFFSSCLSACFSPVKVGSQYIINRVPEAVPHKHTRGATILIYSPSTLPVYDTTQMAYRSNPYQVSYFAKNNWAATPSQMLQPLLVQTLQNTHYFHAVVTAPFVGFYDYTLDMTILQLEQDFLLCPPQLELKARVQINKVITNRVIATKEFFVSVPLPKSSPYGGVIAANIATEELLREIAAFTIAKAK